MEGPREIFILHITNQICFMKTYTIYLVIFLIKATSPFIISGCFFRRTYSAVNLNRTYFVLLLYNSYVKNSSLDDIIIMTYLRERIRKNTQTSIIEKKLLLLMKSRWK